MRQTYLYGVRILLSLHQNNKNERKKNGNKMDKTDKNRLAYHIRIGRYILWVYILGTYLKNKIGINIKGRLFKIHTMNSAHDGFPNYWKDFIARTMHILDHQLCKIIVCRVLITNIASHELGG